MKSSSFKGSDQRVTSPPEGAQSEEVILSANKRDLQMSSIDYKLLSNFNCESGEKVNTPSEYKQLFELANTVLNNFKKETPNSKLYAKTPNSLKLDMEWFMVPDQSSENKVRPVILQSRPMPLVSKDEVSGEKADKLITKLLTLP